MSEGGHQLLDSMASSSVAKLERQKGSNGETCGAGRAATTVISCKPSCIRVLHAGSATPGRGGAEAEGKKVQVDAEAGGEDERGEGDDLDSKGQREEPAAAREDTNSVKDKTLYYPHKFV